MVLNPPTKLGPQPSFRATGSEPESLNILRFWRDVEAFVIPSAPSDRDNDSSTKVSELRPGDPLPWAPNSRIQPDGDDQWVWTHNVFLGVADMESFARLILAACLQGQALLEGELDRIQGRGWLAGCVLDDSGRPVPDSYIPASFALGVKRLREGNSLDELSEDLKIAPSAFNVRRHCIPIEAGGQPEQSPLPSLPPILGWPELEDELAIAFAPFKGQNPEFDPLVVVKSVRKKRSPRDRKVDAPDIDFLNSFYLNDLGLLIGLKEKKQKFGKALESYLGPATKEQIDILTDLDQMNRCIDPGILPAGRWPSDPDHHLYLAQQAAVSTILNDLSSGSGLIAVNGPPGTGKTTLLCDVIADIVTQRAQAIASLKNPWDVFEGQKVKIGSKDAWILRKDHFGGSGIVVTSNNNSAVENISRELPARKKLHPAFGQPAYFKTVSDQMFRSAGIAEDTWGLFAGALGSASRRYEFSRVFFRDEKPPTMAQKGVPEGDGVECSIKPPSSLLDGGVLNEGVKNEIDTIKQILERCSSRGDEYRRKWLDARTEFIRMFERFQTEKGKLESARDSLVELRKLRSQLKCAREAVVEASENLKRIQVEHQERSDSARTHVEDSNISLARRIEEQGQLDKMIQLASASEKMEQQMNPPAFWERVVRNLFGIRTRQYAEWEGRVNQANRALRDALSAATAVMVSVKAARAEAQQAQNEFERFERMKSSALAEGKNRVQQHTVHCELLRSKIEPINRLHQGLRDSGVTIPDDDFWNLPHAKRHLSHPWTSRSLDELRSRLFLEAIKLHELTVCACAVKFLILFRAVKNMLMGVGPEPLTEEARGCLWDALFFVVPVISTTLASFDRLFLGMGQESIGWLLVDEAGQATPQSLVGALWRTRRAVIVGDPKQVEPVMTVPGALVKALRDRYPGVGPEWSPTESAQTISDRVTSLGAWIGGSEGENSAGVWTGMPLRAHRRCDSPMFDVANDIAYSGQMVQTIAGANPKSLTNDPGPSQWLDVQSHASDGQVVKEEVAILLERLEAMKAQWPSLDDDVTKRAKVYVISPFRKVANACASSVRSHGLGKEPFGVECGTVHKFQGKEAEVVFLVLGSAPGKKGEGSRKWASNQPNILNVALTRAKNRIYVIGSKQDWATASGFDRLLEVLT